MISGEDTIASIPRVRVRDLVSVDVPAVAGVPVRVHDATARILVLKDHPSHRPLNHGGLNFIRDIKVRQSQVPIVVIFVRRLAHSRARLARRDSREKFLKTMTRKP